MSDVERGRLLVASGNHDPAPMLDRLALIDYYHSQRKLVEQRGKCSADCQCEQVKHFQGHLVCPHTWEPCKRIRLSEIVNLFSRINKR